MMVFFMHRDHRKIKRLKPPLDVTRTHCGSEKLRREAASFNKITGANAGGPRQLPMRTRWAARVAQFWRWAS